MKVYLTISSDESHKYIFSEREKVDELKERFPDEYLSDPEEITIDHCPIRPDGELFHVTMSKVGTVEDIYPEELVIDYKDHYNVNGICFDINNDFYTWVWAEDEDEAVLIVDSMRQKLLETGVWGKHSWES